MTKNNQAPNNILEIKSDAAVLAHVNMLQGIIDRLAGNSANCKNWLVGILAAIFILLFSTDKIAINTNMYWMYFSPIFLFLFLNCYYLGQERMFVKKQHEFVQKLNSGQIDVDEIFLGKPKINESCVGMKIWNLIKKFFKDLTYTIGGLFSFSIIIFYGVAILIVRFVLNHLIVSYPQ